MTHLAPRFEADPISSIRFRPRTPPEDIPTLFYSAMDVKRFKEEYRQLLRIKGCRSQKIARGSSVVATPELGQQTNDTTRRQAHLRPQRQDEYSYDSASDEIGARSHRDRSSYYDPLNDGSLVSYVEYEGDGALDQHTSLDNDISSPLTILGLQGHISSVLDMARDAVFSWNGGHSSGSSGQQRRRRPSTTTVQLVDTLYLF